MYIIPCTHRHTHLTGLWDKQQQIGVYQQKKNNYSFLGLLYSTKLQKNKEQVSQYFDTKICDYVYILLYVISLRPGL